MSISLMALAGVLFAGPGIAAPLPHGGSEISGAFSVQILNLWPVYGAAPGVSARLWAQVRNNGSAPLPSNALVWFYVDGPTWIGSHYISSTSTASLPPGRDLWYFLDWYMPWNAAEGIYTYRAQVFADQALSDVSEPQTFVVTKGSVPGPATLKSPSRVSATGAPTYTWTPGTKATWYYLWVDDSDNAPRILTWYTAAQAGCSSGLADCKVTPTTVLPPGYYRWWIQTWNIGGYGPWSDGMDFVVGGGIQGPYGIEFVTISSGEFQMGSDAYPGSEETPVHRVIISQSLEIGKYEISQGQWKAVMGNNPSGFKVNDYFPVETVSWNDVQQFVAKMNLLNDGFLYRLPTEAEWEYACRAGTTGELAGDLDTMGWYYYNSSGTSHAVGRKKPNDWGLYDMHGNVWEWVQDWYGWTYFTISPLVDPQGPESGYYRVARGGSWEYDAQYCRSANRYSAYPDSKSHAIGFRLVRAPKTRS